MLAMRNRVAPDRTFAPPVRCVGILLSTPPAALKVARMTPTMRVQSLGKGQRAEQKVVLQRPGTDTVTTSCNSTEVQDENKVVSLSPLRSNAIGVSDWSQDHDDQSTLPDPYLTPSVHPASQPPKVKFHDSAGACNASFDSMQSHESGVRSISLGSFQFPEANYNSPVKTIESQEGGSCAEGSWSATLRALPRFLHVPALFAWPSHPPDVSVDANSSVGDDTAFYTTDEDSVASSVQITPQQIKERKAQAMLDFWQARVQTHAPQRKTVQAQNYLNLGHAQLRHYEYQNAIKSYQQAYDLYVQLPRAALSLAHVLDRLGVACCGAAGGREGDSSSYLIYHAQEYYTQCFWIRKQELGLWHVDTVNTLAHLAHVLVQMRHYKDALHCYKEVLQIRQLIFGEDHPSVAVAAHDLAKVCLKTARLDEAREYLDQALYIYQEVLHLQPSNPALMKLLKNLKQVDRLDDFVTQTTPP